MYFDAAQVISSKNKINKKSTQYSTTPAQPVGLQLRAKQTVTTPRRSSQLERSPSRTIVKKGGPTPSGDCLRALDRPLEVTQSLMGTGDARYRKAVGASAHLRKDSRQERQGSIGKKGSLPQSLKISLTQVTNIANARPSCNTQYYNGLVSSTLSPVTRNHNTHFQRASA